MSIKISAFIKIKTNCLDIKCPAIGYENPCAYDQADIARFKAWIARYHEALYQTKGQVELLKLGRSIYTWLNGNDGWLNRMIDTIANAPLLIEFRTPLEYSGDVSCILELPWELLANDNGYLAADPLLRYTPLRRFEQYEKVEEDRKIPLSLIFMATLNYTEEETAMLEAGQGINLMIEETGNLKQLAVLSKNYTALHLSCGLDFPDTMLLESTEGRSAPVKAAKFIEAMVASGGICPYLITISSELKSQTWSIMDTLARTWFAAGISAVLGYPGPLSEAETILFFKCFYQSLHQGHTLEKALANARYELLTNHIENESSHNWHLPRLYLGPAPDYPATLQCPAYKDFLDTKRMCLPVAGQALFSGRRRQIQSILQAINHSKQINILYGGVGLGKASTAACILRRGRFKPVIIDQNYDATSILEDFGIEFANFPSITDIVECGLNIIRQSPKQLTTILLEILDKCQKEAPQNQILCIAYFKQTDMLKSFLDAFVQTKTRARLLILSTVRFVPPVDEDICNFIQLEPMEIIESKKQAQKRITAFNAVLSCNDLLTMRCIAVAHGNPGTQHLLFSLALEKPELCNQVLDQIDSFLLETEELHEEKLLTHIHQLVGLQLIECINTQEINFLKVVSIFRMPMPLKILEKIAEDCNLFSTDRVFALGIMYAFDHKVLNSGPVGMLNLFFRHYIKKLTASEQKNWAVKIIRELLKHEFQDSELIRLGLIAEDMTILKDHGANILKKLRTRGLYRESLALANQLIAYMKNKKMEAPANLLFEYGMLLCLGGQTQSGLKILQHLLQAFKKIKRQDQIDVLQLQIAKYV